MRLESGYRLYFRFNYFKSHNLLEPWLFFIATHKRGIAFLSEKSWLSAIFFECDAWILIGRINVGFESRFRCEWSFIDFEVWRGVFGCGLRQVVRGIVVFWGRGSGLVIFSGGLRLDLWEHSEYFLALIIGVRGIP